MIFNESFFNKLLKKRNLNIIVHGNDTTIFNNLKLDKKISHNVEYSENNDIYLIDIKPSKKYDLIELITDFTVSQNYYNSELIKKVFILLNVQNLNKSLTLKVKCIVESAYETTSFIIHSKRINQLDINQSEISSNIATNYGGGLFLSSLGGVSILRGLVSTGPEICWGASCQCPCSSDHTFPGGASPGGFGLDRLV